MKTFTKTVLCVMAFAGMSMASAETFNLAKQNFFWKPKKGFTTNGTEFTTTGMTFLSSQKLYDVDPAKKYSVKIKVNSSVPRVCCLYVGFELHDAKGKSYQAVSWQGYPETFTQITRPAKIGDKVIYVKNGANWSTVRSVYFALDAKADGSDIPNTKIVYNNVASKKKVGNEWEITLTAPLKINLPAGKSVRQHAAGGYFYVINKRIMPKDKELVLSGSVQGFAKTIGQYNGKNWPAGVGKVRFVILADWGTKVNSPLTFKEATFTIE